MSWNFFDAWVPKRQNFKVENCTEKEVKLQEIKCLGKYDDWNECVKNKGFNDAVCRENLLENYYSCVGRLNAMKECLEDKDIS